MRNRESKTPTTGKAVAYIPTTDQVEADIKRFMSAAADVKDVPLTEEDILSDLQQVMDDELLTGLNKLMHHWCFVQPYGITQADIDDVYVVEHLRQKVEQLVRARMRDVLVVKLKASHS